MAKLEQEIETEIINYLNKSDNILAFKFPRGQKSYSRKNTVTHSGSGVADILVNYSYGGLCFMIYLEVKAKYGKQRDSQVKFQKAIESMGGFYYVVRSLEETKAYLDLVVTEIEKRILIARIPW